MTTPADLTAILAEHAPTFTEMAHDPNTTFYCKSCSEAAGDWVTWTPEHVAEQITAAGFGLHNSSADVDRITEERDAAVRAVEAERDALLQQQPFRVAGANRVRAEQAEAREKALRESVEALAEKWRGQREPFGNALLDDLHALLATSPDREDGASAATGLHPCVGCGVELDGDDPNDRCEDCAADREDGAS